MENLRTLTAIATASLLVAFAAHANKGAQYHAQHAEHHKNFFITGGATYLEPSMNGLDYASVWTDPTSGSSIPVLSNESLQPEFNWGYFIQAGYRISHHYDIQASWAQYNSKVSDSLVFENAPGLSSYLYTSNGNYLNKLTGSEMAFATSNQTIDYSVFDANLGQYHDITEMLRARLYAGINYAKVDASTHNFYNQPTNTPTTLFDHYSSTFNGWGPEIGLDLEYKVWHTLGVVGHFATSFLIGQLETESNVYNFNDRLPTQTQVDGDTTARLIPAVEAKLGMNWDVPYAYEKCSFGIEAGYQVAYYWDVIDQMDIDYYTSEPSHNYANYGNMGPYLNFTAMF